MLAGGAEVLRRDGRAASCPGSDGRRWVACEQIERRVHDERGEGHRKEVPGAGVECRGRSPSAI